MAQLAVLQCLVDFADLLEDQQRHLLSQHLARRSEEDEQFILEALERAGPQLENARLLQESVVATIAQRLEVVNNELERKRFRACLQAGAAHIKQTRNMVLPKIASALSRQRSNELDDVAEFALEALSELGTEGADSSLVSELAENLVDQVRQAPGGHKGRWAEASLGLLETFPEAQKTTLSAVIAETLGQGDADQVRQFLEALTPQNLTKVLASEDHRAALRQQAANFLSRYSAVAREQRTVLSFAKEQRKAVLSLFPSRALSAALTETTNDSHTWDVELAFELIGEAYTGGGLSNEEFESVAHQLVQKFVRGAVAQQAQALLALAKPLDSSAPGGWSVTFTELLADLGVELIKAQPPSGRMMLRSLAGVLSREQRQGVVEELLADLLTLDAGGHPITDHIDYLEVVVEFGDPLTRSATSRMNELATRALGAAQPPETVSAMMSILEKLPQLSIGARARGTLKSLAASGEFAELALKILTRQRPRS